MRVIKKQIYISVFIKYIVCWNEWATMNLFDYFRLLDRLDISDSALYNRQMIDIELIKSRMVKKNELHWQTFPFPLNSFSILSFSSLK